MQASISGQLLDFVHRHVAKCSGAPFGCLLNAYGSLFVAVAIYVIYKLLTADSKVKKAEERASARSEAFGEVPGATCVVFLVHGTWALRSMWHRPKSIFIKDLNDRLDPHKVQYRSFLWTGGNSILARDRASERLRTALEKSLSESSLPHFMVCHSHAGNVALQVLRENGRIADQIRAVFCIATPFIMSYAGIVVSTSRFVRFLAPVFRKISVALASAAAIWSLVPNQLELVWRGVIPLGVAVLAWHSASLFASKVRKTTIPAEGLESHLFQKVVVIRAGGDEAAAALGAAYILRFALLAAYGFMLQKVNSSLEVFKIEDPISPTAPVPFAFTSTVVALLIYVSRGAWPGETYYRIAVVVAGVVCSACVAWLLFALVANLVKVAVDVILSAVEVVTLILYMPADLLSCLCLLPFAPELVLASAEYGLSAEAAVPLHLPPGKTPPNVPANTVFQLKYEGRRLLNHSAYDLPETPAIIGDCIRQML